MRPGVFSISFGSLPALRLAADPRRAEAIGGVMVFGGYAEWELTVRFCLGGGGGVPHDPLNRPVVFLNLLHQLPPPADAARLCAAWRRFTEETWGRPSMRVHDAWMAVARRLAEEVAPEDRHLFLQGCGVEPGGERRVEEALGHTEAWAWLDPRPYLGALHAPVVLAHGADDDVIPYSQSHVLATACPASSHPRVLITGMYGHTGRAGALGRLPLLLRELRTLWALLDAIMAITTVPEAHRHAVGSEGP